MKTREKIAITVDPDLLAEVERLRKKSGESRSAVFERALSSYFHTNAQLSQERKHADGYRRLPETAAEGRAALAAAQDALIANPWNDER